MKVNITGRHMETGAALQAHVETALDNAISKYFERGGDASVTFSKQGHQFEAACALHLDSGLYLHASGSDADVYTSFDQSIGKIEKQLRRYKRRLKNHHEQKKFSEAVMMAPEKILQPDAEHDAPAEFTPVVIAENRRSVSEMSVSEAVMQLELGADDFVLFKTAGRDPLNIVHKRNDGNIGWLELSG